MNRVIRWTKEKARQVTYAATGKTEAEKMVLEAINDDPWGPANSTMAAVARLTYNYNDNECLKRILWSQLSNGMETRKVQKSLLLLEYLLRHGNESVRGDARMMVNILQSLTYLQRHDSGELAALETVIRKKSSDIIQLINDDESYSMEREKARKLAGVTTATSNSAYGGFGAYSSSYVPSPSYGASSFGGPSSNYGASGPSYGGPASNYGGRGPSYGGPNPGYGAATPNYGGSNPSHVAPSPSPYGKPNDEDDELDFDPRQSSSAFGQSQGQQPQFGGSVQSAQQSVFGSQPAQGQGSFGNQMQSSPFGAQDQSTLFGSRPQQNQFGMQSQNSPSPFGTQPQAQQSLFGTQAQQSPFGAQPQAQQSLFGAQPQAQQSPFGSQQQQTGLDDILALAASPAPQTQHQQQFGGIDLLGFGNARVQPQNSSKSDAYNDYGGIVDLDLSGESGRRFGKANALRGSGPQMGGF